jgi:hypothetical protein
LESSHPKTLMGPPHQSLLLKKHIAKLLMKFLLMSSKRYHLTWLSLFAIKLIDWVMLQTPFFPKLMK